MSVFPPDPAGAAPAGAPTGRKRRRLLIASILLNVFLIGAIGAGAIARHGPHFFDGGRERPPRPFEMPSPRKIRAALPEEARPIADALFAAHREEMATKIGMLIEARRAVATAIRAEPFDRAALDAALATLRSLEVEMAGTVQAIIADLAEDLDAESRDRLAKLLETRRGPDEPR
jgi:uncharacterized membrane protein